MTDTRYVYGIACTWNGPAQYAGQTVGTTLLPSVPCCPTCGGMLLAMPDEHTYLSEVVDYEERGHPGFLEFIVWLRGKCFQGPGMRGLEPAKFAYERLTGRTVTL